MSAGWVARAGDCDDADSRAFPGQTLRFATPRANGSYDYDCSGTEDPEPLALGRCEVLGQGCDYRPGLAPGEVARCGAAARMLTACIQTPTTCEASHGASAGTVVRCR